MEQVKIFEGVPGFGSFEKKVNVWLAENANQLEVVRVLQSSAASGTSGGMSAILHLAIFYIQKKK